LKPAEFRRLRRKLGYTQGEWAKALKITREYCNALENGRREITERMAAYARMLSRNSR
jgi:DNA-binding XRE family transcriptional regulator